jgi:hypothetical protein
VRKNAYEIKFIDTSYINYDDIVNICTLAVMKNGLSLHYALKYLKDQNDDICILALKNNNLAIKYIKEQNEIICGLFKNNEVSWNNYNEEKQIFVNGAIYIDEKYESFDIYHNLISKKYDLHVIH